MRFVLIFLAGLLCGAFLRLGADIALFRPGVVGGELLIVPLMMLLVWAGFQVASAIASHKKKQPKVECRVFDNETIIENCTVQILENSITGEQSVGWWHGCAKDIPS